MAPPAIISETLQEGYAAGLLQVRRKMDPSLHGLGAHAFRVRKALVESVSYPQGPFGLSSRSTELFGCLAPNRSANMCRRGIARFPGAEGTPRRASRVMILLTRNRCLSLVTRRLLERRRGRHRELANLIFLASAGARPAAPSRGPLLVSKASHRCRPSHEVRTHSMVGMCGQLNHGVQPPRWCVVRAARHQS